MRGCFIVLGVTVFVACAPDGHDPVSLQFTQGSGTTPVISASSWGPETPPFNNEIILRDVTGAGGFGHVKFRQPNDDNLTVHLDTWVRDLVPNTSYRLQRAVDTEINDDCTSTAWLTLGQGATPAAIVTDDRGTGRAALFRTLTSPLGATFDIHFRVIDPSGVAVLESACYQFVVTQ
jgi:hypothetical protein